MQGWSLFKQGRLDDALQSFFGVLDLQDGRAAMATTTRQPGRPDARRPRTGRRHLPRHQPQPGQPAGRRVDPALHQLATRGAATSSASTSSSASSTSSKTASRTPPTPSAPSPAASRCMRRRRMLQARVIEIYQQSRLRHAGARGEEGLRVALRHRQRIPPRQRRGLGARAAAGQDAPHRTGAPLPRQRAEEQGQRRLPGGRALVPRLSSRRSRPTPTRRRTTSCSPNCCSKTAASPKPPSSTRRPPTTTRRTPRAPTPATPRCSATPQLEKRAAAAELPALQRSRRRQRAALREGLPGRPAHRRGADATPPRSCSR